MVSRLSPSNIIEIRTFIDRSPDTCGNRPRITGTRVQVQRIAGCYKMGFNAEEIRDRIGHLTLAQVYAALTYYHANKEEIENYLLEEERDYDRLEALEVKADGERSQGKRMAEVLTKLAQTHAVDSIADPVAWQKEAREDRMLFDGDR